MNIPLQIHNAEIAMLAQPRDSGTSSARQAETSFTYLSLEAVLAPDNVRAAWNRVRRNQGCAGVDGVSIAELEPQFDQEWLQIERAVRSGSYKPRPLLRVRIPKPSGGERLLGIPAVMDRVVQQSVTQILSLCWEPRFSARSFAYRPGRGPRDALLACERAMERSGEWVLHLDIEDFFDSVPHLVVLTALAGELADERVATLIQRTLACSVYECGLVHHRPMGLAQGSPLSPLIANVVLHHLDQRLENTGFEFVRYADDCVIFLARQELDVSARQTVVETLESLGLRLNERKTAFGHFTSARFLGFTFRRDERGRAVRIVSPEALAEAREALLQKIQSSAQGSEAFAAELAGLLRSWLAYFHAPYGEAPLRLLVEQVRSAWTETFPDTVAPSCLCWEALCSGGDPRDHVDYSGQMRGDSENRLDWVGTCQCLLDRLLRSRWWHLEYDLGRGKRPGVRLWIGRHRINLRF